MAVGSAAATSTRGQQLSAEARRGRCLASPRLLLCSEPPAILDRSSNSAIVYCQPLQNGPRTCRTHKAQSSIVLHKMVWHGGAALTAYVHPCQQRNASQHYTMSQGVPPPTMIRG